MMIRQIRLALALLGTTACSFAQVPAIKEGEVTRLDAHTIQIEGLIDPALPRKFLAAMTEETRTVVLTSEGGATKMALDIAEEIERRHLNVVVRKYCISSCANYLFVAGEGKSVEDRSILSWHGGHSNDPFAASGDECKALAQNRDILRREQLLYLRRGVSLDLIIYSGYLTLGAQTGETSEIVVLGKTLSIPVVKREFGHWIPSRETLERLGVKKIRQFWHPDSEIAAVQLLESYGFAKSGVYLGAPYSRLPSIVLSTKQ